MSPTSPHTLAIQDFDLDASLDTVLGALGDLWESALRSLPQVVLGLIVLLATWGAVRLVTSVLRRVLKRTSLRGSLRDLILQLASSALWVFGVLGAAMVVFPGVTPGKLLTVLGLGSIAIGFAFKDIFENFFAGILILWRFPLEKGDFVEVEGITGRVEDVTIRMTQIRETDDELVVLPNAHLFKNPVRILTNKTNRRLTVMIGVDYDADLAQSRQVLEQAVAGCESVAQDPGPQIFAQSFGASSIDFELTWWAESSPLGQRRSRDEVVEAAKRALDEAGISIPFPHRTLTFKQPLDTRRADPA